MNAPVASKPYPLNLRAIYIVASQLGLGEDFDPLIPGQSLVGWHKAQPDGARVNELKVETTGNTLHTVEFRTNFEFIYRTLKPGQALDNSTDPLAMPSPVPPEEFDGMRLAAKVSATMVASFVLFEGAPAPNSGEILAWAHGTVLQVSWPYWREYCQTAFHRMQMPQTLIPLLTITQKPVLTPTVEQPEPAVKTGRSSATRKMLRPQPPTRKG